jgi:prepilin-type N-terminal cleavage/methylation domain-containing protein
MNTSHQQIKRHTKSSGFSLVEVLVSLTIFTIVVTISVGSLLVLIDANAKSQSMQVVMTNLNFTLDSMTREIRTGEGYFCGAHSTSTLPTNDSAVNPSVQDCLSGGSAFSFREGGGSGLTTGLTSRRIAYRLTETLGLGRIERRLADESWIPVTAADVDINELRFVVSGTSRNDQLAPSATIFINGTVRQGEVSGTDFSIQTTVAQLLLDI